MGIRPVARLYPPTCKNAAPFLMRISSSFRGSLTTRSTPTEAMSPATLVSFGGTEQVERSFYGSLTDLRKKGEVKKPHR